MSVRDFPRYTITKKELIQAGERLRNNDKKSEGWIKAYELLSKWRSMHAYPLNTFQAAIRLLFSRHNKKEVIVAQRLKRLSSILSKLDRYKTMRLNRIQDIGGIRIIFPTLNDVYSFYNKLKKTRWKHELHNEKDYINEPKQSGYRSIHLIYSYNNVLAPDEYQGLHIEIQLRTYLQHIWATTVETIGTFINHSLKSSQGLQNWLNYFILVSAVFALEEHSPVPEAYKNININNLVKELHERTLSLNAFSILKTFHSAVQILEAPKFKNKYILLILNFKENYASFKAYNQKDYNRATAIYEEFEKNKAYYEDAVLVSSKSLNELRKAYPNYFIDSSEFINHLNRLFQKYNLLVINS